MARLFAWLDEQLAGQALLPGNKMALGVDEGLEQYRAIAVALTPINGQLSGDLRQDLRGEAFGLNPGQDQQSGVVDDELQLLQALGFLPADEALAPGELPGTRAEAQQRDQLFARGHVVAHLAARMLAAVRPRASLVARPRFDGWTG